MQGRVGDALKVLLLISTTKEEAEQRLRQIKCVVGIDENCTLDIAQVPQKTSSGKGALKELFCKSSPPVRRIFITAVGLHLFLRIGGSAAILLYSLKFLLFPMIDIGIPIEYGILSLILIKDPTHVGQLCKVEVLCELAMCDLLDVDVELCRVLLT